MLLDDSDRIEDLYDLALERYLAKAQEDFGTLEEWSEREKDMINRIIYPELVKKKS